MQKILLVDDKPANLVVLERILADTEVEKLQALSGNETLKVLWKHPDVTLILLDLNMPDMSGLEVAQILREMEQFCHIPIIFVTAADPSSDILSQAYGLGAVDFILKPIDDSVLLAKVNVFLSLEEKKHALERAVIEANYWRDFNHQVLDLAPSLLYLSADFSSFEPLNIRAKNADLSDAFNEFIHTHFHHNNKTLADATESRMNTHWRVEHGGKEETYVVTISPFYFGDKKQLLAALENVSEQENARRAAEEADRAKSNFLANMSHEIRTPLNGILGMASLLAREELNTSQREYANTILSCGEHLLTVINDILDFSKIEAGRMEIDRISFDLPSMVEACIMTFSTKALEKRIELAYEIEPRARISCSGDKTRLQQVLTNLVSNAVKFTHKGYVKLTVTVEEETQDGCLLTFSIQDSGIGIATEKIPQLFEAFTQAEMSTTRKYGGTGLGLTISRKLVDMMGGQLFVESDVDKGSRFYFTLPVADIGPSLIEPAAEVSPKIEGIRALIVDDMPVNLEILEKNLALWGLNVTSMSEPVVLEDVLSAAKNADLIILDYQMPSINGADLAQQIRSQLEMTPPIILFSSVLHIPEEERKLFTQITYKPFRLSVFFDVLMRALFDKHHRFTSQQKPITVKRATGNTYPLNLLIAEDNEVNQRLMQHYLRDMGYKPALAENGQQVLDYLRDHSVDVVLMDMLMPVMDGIQATKEIRQLYGDSAPEVIAVTANATKEDKALCKQVGMSDFLAKPVSDVHLAEALERAYARINNKRTAKGESPPRNQNQLPQHAVSKAAPLNFLSEIDVLDTQRFASFPTALQQQLVSSFENEWQAGQERILHCFEQDDFGQLEKSAHKLKGACYNIGCLQLGKICEHFQECGENQLSPEESLIALFSQAGNEALTTLKVSVNL
ncbi:response regulator [Aestuariibacter sp. AA17]|uniref:histidine kinase n=1 Tax=Fluctibacter corallii TaxID=2984329 RepID=A0ABT3A8S0_9ALTE|nr:response regulator [Aestuariibacter sp. AA17]MCV2885013.1 response regulator [Aestuariibacter sp. AA17]